MRYTPMLEKYCADDEKYVTMRPEIGSCPAAEWGCGQHRKKEVSGMISFLLCLALLIVGYFVYGKIVD